ncbi:hypothetical protein AOQ84DRAFT_436443 [Glonium stellatum]|uniref:Zn(2)-C6 fungal-type domain-containing protein n=1 Tax=Glonium stellatum TaxID=574774 RepID=A0A8E2FA70_9PEZI|nr:hypothetical protein AOQ84DRAFT_436443 [Glonium stellatum]
MLPSTSRTPISTRADTNSHAVKRRQVRKGTFSCWECKRRKTRCEFKHKSSFVCVSCQRRGISCIGQQFADPAESSDVGAEERVVQVESLVSQLIQQGSTQPTWPSGLNITNDENENDDSRDDISVQVADLNAADNINWHLPSLLTTTHKLFPGSRSLSSQLHAVLPHPTKAALILTRGKFSNLPIHARGQPSRKITSSMIGAEHLAQVSELPLPTAHPVHFAHKPIYDAARRYFNIASRYVTSQDFLMDSIDGVETLMLQSCYYINLGDTRSAWLVVRRALTIAQLIGLPLQTKEADCREENVWFRLVLGDRCLSWILGLSPAVTDNTFASEHELVADAWSAKLERIHTVVFGRIITRNLRMQRRRRCRHLEEAENDPYDDCQVTQEIDYELKQAARSPPTDWWLCPSLNNGFMHVETMDKTEKLIAQMHHHFLLIILHQPYLIRKLPTPTTIDSAVSARSPFNDAYSQIAVLSASREALSRFVLLRSFHRTLSYRGVDDKAFVASMMFLLVHLNGHSLGRANVLEHQRLHDLGIINEVISIIKETSFANKDALGTSMVQVLKKLLEIEAHSADGRSCFIWMEESPVGKDNYEIREDDDGLSLPIPYFGSIRIASQEPRKLQSPADLGLNSIYTAELASGISTATGYSDTRYTIGDQDSTDVPSVSNLQLQHTVPINEAIDYDENLDWQLSMDLNMQDVSQSPTHTPQGLSPPDQMVDPQYYPNQEEDTTFLKSWLNEEIPPDENQVETEV